MLGVINRHSKITGALTVTLVVVTVLGVGTYVMIDTTQVELRNRLVFNPLQNFWNTLVRVVGSGLEVTMDYLVHNIWLREFQQNPVNTSYSEAIVNGTRWTAQFIRQRLTNVSQLPNITQVYFEPVTARIPLWKTAAYQAGGIAACACSVVVGAFCCCRSRIQRFRQDEVDLFTAPLNQQVQQKEREISSLHAELDQLHAELQQSKSGSASPHIRHTDKILKDIEKTGSELARLIEEAKSVDNNPYRQPVRRMSFNVLGAPPAVVSEVHELAGSHRASSSDDEDFVYQSFLPSSHAGAPAPHSQTPSQPPRRLSLSAVHQPWNNAMTQVEAQDTSRLQTPLRPTMVSMATSPFPQPPARRASADFSRTFDNSGHSSASISLFPNNQTILPASSLPPSPSQAARQAQTAIVGTPPRGAGQAPFGAQSPIRYAPHSPSLNLTSLPEFQLAQVEQWGIAAAQNPPASPASANPRINNSFDRPDANVSFPDLSQSGQRLNRNVSFLPLSPDKQGASFLPLSPEQQQRQASFLELSQDPNAVSFPTVSPDHSIN